MCMRDDAARAPVVEGRRPWGVTVESRLVDATERARATLVDRHQGVTVES